MNLRKDNKKKKPMQLMLDEISGMMGVSQEMILSRMISRNISDSRMLFCYMAYEEGYLFREIASFLKISRCRATTAYYGTEMSETKIILDACCGSRMFWFDKKNPLALFADIRDEEYILCDGRNLKVHPDIVSDFTDMPFLDKSFKLVVFDPPHLLKVGKNSWLAKKYGKLPEDWPRVIKKGIDECFRVLDDYGVLIFKWNEDQITVREVLSAINRQPLFGHTTGRHGKTMWMCFMKLPIN